MKRQSVDRSLRTEKIVETYNKSNKDSLLNFFCLQNMSKPLNLQYNGIRLIQLIKTQKERKENHTFFLTF